MSSGTVGNIVKIGGFAAAIAVGGALGGFLAPAILIGASIAGGLLKRRGLGRAQEGIQFNVLSNEAFIPIVYGEAKIGLTIAEIRVDANSTDRKDLAWVGAICSAGENGDGIEGVSKVWFNEILAINAPTFEGEPSVVGIDAAFQGSGPFASGSFFTYGLHAGADAQVVDAELTSRFPSSWPATAEGPGVAYLSTILHFDQDIFPGSFPNVTVLVKGNKVYDPRSSTWAWSDNPALCILDFLTSKKYGLGANYDERDGGGLSEIDEQTFIDTANYHDETVSVPGGTQKRFTCNGWLDPGSGLENMLESLLTSCRGQLIYASGKFHLVTRRVVAAETFELTEDNIIGDWEFFRSGTRETPNKTVATFINKAIDYQPDDASWPEADVSNGFLTADNGFENERRFDLPFTDNKYMAQHIGLVSLKEARADVGAAVLCTEAALQLNVGEVVKLTHSTPGWTQKEFWVLALAILPDATIHVVLREYDATAYTLDTLNTEDTPPGTELPNPLLVQPPTSVTAIATTATTLTTQDGQRVPRIKLAWTAAAEPFLSHYNVRFKLSTDSAFQFAGKPLAGETELYIWPVTDGLIYNVEIEAVNTSGSKSATVAKTVTIVTNTHPAQAIPHIELDALAVKLFTQLGINAGSVRYVDAATAPTEAAIRAGTVVTAASVTVHTFTTGVAETRHVGVFVYTDASGNNGESAVFRFVIQNAGADSNPAPALDSVATDEVDDDGSFLQWDASWSHSGTDTTQHELVIQYFDDGVLMVGEDQVVELDVAQPLEHQTAIPGGGSSGHLFNNKFIIRLKFDDTSLAVKDSSQVSPI